MQNETENQVLDDEVYNKLMDDIREQAEFEKIIMEMAEYYCGADE